jgi:hypothetical protein
MNTQQEKMPIFFNERNEDDIFPNRSFPGPIRESGNVTGWFKPDGYWDLKHKEWRDNRIVRLFDATQHLASKKLLTVTNGTFDISQVPVTEMQKSVPNIPQGKLRFVVDFFTPGREISDPTSVSWVVESFSDISMVSQDRNVISIMNIWAVHADVLTEIGFTKRTFTPNQHK